MSVNKVPFLTNSPLTYFRWATECQQSGGRKHRTLERWGNRKLFHRIKKKVLFD